MRRSKPSGCAVLAAWGVFGVPVAALFYVLAPRHPFIAVLAWVGVVLIGCIFNAQ